MGLVIFPLIFVLGLFCVFQKAFAQEEKYGTGEELKSEVRLPDGATENMVDSARLVFRGDAIFRDEPLVAYLVTDGVVAAKPYTGKAYTVGLFQGGTVTYSNGILHGEATISKNYINIKDGATNKGIVKYQYENGRKYLLDKKVYKNKSVSSPTTPPVAPTIRRKSQCAPSNATNPASGEATEAGKEENK